MPRVTPTEVLTLTGSTVSTSVVLLHIEAANALTDTLVGQGLSDAVLRLIELNLAAHFSYENGLSGSVESEAIGDARVTYRTPKTSPYWELAVRLSGGLLLGVVARRATFDVYT